MLNFQLNTTDVKTSWIKEEMSEQCAQLTEVIEQNSKAKMTILTKLIAAHTILTRDLAEGCPINIINDDMREIIEALRTETKLLHMLKDLERASTQTEIQLSVNHSTFVMNGLESL